MACIRSAARPTVRYFRPLRSAALLIGFLNQPSGWVGIGMAKKLLMLTFMIWVWSSSNSSLPPPLWIQPRPSLALKPNTGPVPNSEAALCLPYQ